MNLQYISDNRGKTTGVFIPIKDWNRLKKRYKELEGVDAGPAGGIPGWHKHILDERLASMGENPGNFVDFDTACDDIEKEL